MALLDDFDFESLTAPVVEVDQDAFVQGMRQLAASVTIVTTMVGEVRNGLTATAVCSLSAEPPTLLACVNRSASAHDPTLQSRVFCVNVLAQQHLELAMQFSSSKRLDERFTTGQWGTLESGAPVLMDSLVSFDCVLGETLRADTHTVLVGRVQAVRYNPELEPLLYWRGQFGSFTSEQG
jgi:flavin reductase (DIM6/NTAB) family NADH-FMN oxidoreductase RutF